MAIQRQVVQWFIALFGMSYAKAIKLETVKEMLKAQCTKLALIPDVEAAAKEFPVGESSRQQVSYTLTYFDILVYVKFCISVA